jgi:hypothetical protein
VALQSLKDLGRLTYRRFLELCPAQHRHKTLNITHCFFRRGHWSAIHCLLVSKSLQHMLRILNIATCMQVVEYNVLREQYTVKVRLSGDSSIGKVAPAAYYHRAHYNSPMALAAYFHRAHYNSPMTLAAYFCRYRTSRGISRAVPKVSESSTGGAARTDQLTRRCSRLPRANLIWFNWFQYSFLLLIQVHNFVPCDLFLSLYVVLIHMYVHYLYVILCNFHSVEIYMVCPWTFAMQGSRWTWPLVRDEG